MSENKKYYYLKFKENYFEQDHIKVIEAMDNGYIYSLILLKLYLKSLKFEGQLRINEYIPYRSDKIDLLAKVINHDGDHVMHALNLAKDLGIVNIMKSGEIFIADIQNFIGHSSTEAERKRKYRKRLNSSNKKLKQIQHIPLIENHTNNKRYGGNYYKVFKRDNKMCCVCASVENLLVHHIDGYDENKPENNNVNKMIVLCRKCHGNRFSEKDIKEILKRNGILEKINYAGHSSAIRPPELELELELNIDKELDINNKRKELNLAKKKQLEDTIQSIINCYPTRDYKQNYSTARKNKSTYALLKKLLKRYSADQIKTAISDYLETQKKAKLSIKTFKRFLEEIEIEEYDIDSLSSEEAEQLAKEGKI